MSEVLLPGNYVICDPGSLMNRADWLKTVSMIEAEPTSLDGGIYFFTFDGDGSYPVEVSGMDEFFVGTDSGTIAVLPVKGSLDSEGFFFTMDSPFTVDVKEDGTILIQSEGSQ